MSGEVTLMGKPLPKVSREIMELTDRLVEQGIALTEARRPKDALPILEQVLMHEPEDSGITALVATLHSILGDKGMAIEYCLRAIRLDPECSQAYYLLAMTIIEAEKKEEAEQAIEWARLAVKYDLESTLYFLTLVQAHVFNDDLEEAYRLGLRMREMWPEEEHSHRTLGFVCVRRHAWEEAEEHSRRALAIRPDSQMALINLGVALNNQGRGAEAREAFLRAGRLDPTDKGFQENLKDEFPEGILSI